MSGLVLRERALNFIKQVRHPIAPDDAGGIRQPHSAAWSDGAEEWPTAAEYDGHHIHHDLVDQAQTQRLPADLTGRNVDVPLASEFTRLHDRGRNPISHERERRDVGKLPVSRRGMGDDKHVVARRRHAAPAIRLVEQLAPDHDRTDLRVHSLDEVRGRLRGAARLLLLSVNFHSTSPLPYQSNSGPTSPFMSAM
jgi:hypothetical protein